MSSLAMSKAEREAFLADTHVAVLSIAEDGRGPFSVPVWYRYEPGRDVRIATGGNARKVDLLHRAGRASLCAQTETAPYRYVTVEGPVTIGALDFERDVRQVAIRYLGARLGEAYLAGSAAELEASVLLSLRPARWLTADFSKWGL